MKTKLLLLFVFPFLSLGLSAQFVNNSAGTIPSSLPLKGTAPVSATISSITNEPCNGENIGNATVVASGGTMPYTYTWTTIPSQTNSTAITLSAGTYTVTVTDANEITATAIAIITQPPVLSATTTVINIRCNGSTGNITANATGGTTPYAYAWAPNGGVASTANVSAGTYTVTVSDVNSCTFTTAATITQPPALVVTVTGNQNICSGATDILTAHVTGGTAPYGYTWSTGALTSTATIAPTTTQTYFVTVIDANGCPQTGQITVTVGAAISLTTTGDTSFCSGGDDTLRAIATGGGGGVTYLWQPSNANTSWVKVSPQKTTVYTVTATDQCGKSATDSVTVRVNPTPTASFSANGNKCAPAYITFSNSSSISSGQIVQYFWSFGNGDTLTTSSKSIPIIYYPTSGTDTVSLTAVSDSGCPNTVYDDMLIIYSHPNAAFIISPESSSILEPTIQFTDQSTDSLGISTWRWTFDDATDSTSTRKNTSHTYLDTGTFCPRLIVTNKLGCHDTTINCLTIKPSFTLYIPSSFSPNGDALNDTFEPKGTYIRNFQMNIFNRWGENVYHTNDITKGWNGNMGNGAKNSPEGIYIYKILVTDAEGKSHSYVGNVILIR